VCAVCFLNSVLAFSLESIGTDSKHRNLAVPHDVIGNTAQK
jgi:hypothetical protein